MIRLTSKLIGPHSADTTLTLPWEQRTKSRLRVLLDNGVEAGLFLRRGSVLRAGEMLASEEGFVVEVVAAREPLSIVASPDPLLMARACYHLGNRHAAVAITDRQVHYLHDPVLDDMIKGLGLEIRHDQGPFEPESGAYAGHGHHHD